MVQMNYLKTAFQRWKVFILWLLLPRPVGQSLAVLVVDQVGLPSSEVLAVLHSHGLVDEGPNLLQPRLGALHNLIGILDMERVT